MKKEISILLPVYNNVCVSLVQQLLEQTTEFRDLQFEIIVADDGSDNAELIKRNSEIATMDNCRYLALERNFGRAKVRNFLAQQAKYEWLLFLDSDVKLPAFFLRNYLQEMEGDIVYGGIKFLGSELLRSINLRCRYECMSMADNILDKRNENPYRSFSAANFLIKKEIMLQHPFDERFTGYGYEDVLFGKRLADSNIPICHINNPVHIDQFDNNPEYLAKIEESLKTLKRFKTELSGYSKILESVKTLKKAHLDWTIRIWHMLFKAIEKHNLTGKSPNLTLFKLYKLGYYVCL